VLAAAGQLNECEAARLELLSGWPYDEAVTLAVMPVLLSEEQSLVHFALQPGAPTWAAMFVRTPDGTEVSRITEHDPIG
jgi:hypothetical protein